MEKKLKKINYEGDKDTGGFVTVTIGGIRNYSVIYGFFVTSLLFLLSDVERRVLKCDVRNVCKYLPMETKILWIHIAKFSIKRKISMNTLNFIPYANQVTFLKRSETSKALTIHIDFSTKASINSTSKLATWHQRINNRLCRFSVNNA